MSDQKGGISQFGLLIRDMLIELDKKETIISPVEIKSWTHLLNFKDKKSLTVLFLSNKERVYEDVKRHFQL